MKALKDAMKEKYQVIVGNIGTVYDGNNFKAADEIFYDYVQTTWKRYGRAAGEDVTLLSNREGIMRESHGRRSRMR